MSDVNTFSGNWAPFKQVPIERTRSSAEILADAQVVHRQVGDLFSKTANFRRRTFIVDLEERQNRHAAKATVDLLALVSDAGFAWRDVARIMNVTVPAVQKWRREGGMSGLNRLRLARIVGLLELLESNMVSEPVSWLEMPLRPEVAITKMDLLMVGRFDLVLELLSDDDGAMPIDGILDEYDENWREKYVDNRFESFMAADGMMSVRPKS